MNHPLDAFAKTYVINLASRADRRAEMSKQLQRIGLQLQSERVALFEAIRPFSAGGFPTLGAHGCFMSHLGVLRTARDEGLESVLILEDDLNFSPDFMHRMPALSEQLVQQPWAFFYGGYVLDQRLPATARGWVPAAPEMPVVTTHFVAMHGSVIAPLVSYLEAILARPPGDPAGGPMHVDGAYNWFRREHPDARTWLAVPELGHQRASRTDIHDLRWHDRLPVVRALAAWCRKARNA